MAVCDGPARSKLLNIQGHSSNLGCTVCLENTLKNFKPLKLDEIQYRDDLTWRSLATKITSMGLKPDDKRISSEFQGIKGYTPLMQVPSANLPFFCVTEIMHSVFLGVVKWVIDSLVDKEDAATKTFVSLFNSRMNLFSFPTSVSRTMPYDIKMKKMKTLQYIMFQQQHSN